jgi:stage II sporulation protein AA (anti-sigma F factor antagonist)
MAELADVRFEEQDRTIVVRIGGEIDLSNAWSVAQSIRESISNLQLRVILDLTGVRYLDSAGIRVLFDLARRLADRDQRLVLVLPPDAPIRRSLEVSSLVSQVPMAENIDTIGGE